MKRAQLRRHKVIWLMMLPGLAAIIGLSMMVRPAEDLQSNDALPGFLTDAEQ